MTINKRIKQARIEAGFSTVKAAAESRGLNENTLASNENGNRTPGRELAARYASAFGVSLDWLLQGKGPMKAYPSKIIDIWERIPKANEDAALRMLESLAEKVEAPSS